MTPPTPTAPSPSAGREMDAMIAEKVMGEVEANAPVGDGLTRTATIVEPTMQKANEEIRRAYPKSLAVGKLWGAEYVGPAYSTDIAAAWLIVEKLRADGWCLSLHEEGGKSNQWVADFVRADDDLDYTGEELAPTAPLAICLAALALSGASA